MLNPLRSEPEAFTFLVRAGAVIAFIVIIVLVLRLIF
jgi:hypothetical protein